MEEAARLSEEKATQEEEKSQAQTTQGNNSDQQDAPLSMSELSKRMHCPINYRAALPFLYENERKAKQTPEESLSHIPWRLRFANDDAPAAPRSQQNKPPQDTIMEENLIFSSWTYLELRRHQNTAWASDRLKEGNELLFINPTRAETKFLEGLNLVPDHVDLLTAYAKLLITNSDLPAAESKLKQALEIDPNHLLAQKTQHELIKVQQGRIRMQHQQQLLFQEATTGGNFMKNRNVQVAKGNSIYSDVLMERALMGDDDDDNRREDDNSASKRKSKKDRKRKKKKKKHKRKRKRRYYSSESDDDDSSSRSSRSGSSMEADGRGNDKDETKHHDGPEDDQQEKARDDSDSREDRRRRKDRKRRKRHRKRRRRRDYSSESDDGSRSSVSPKNGEDDGEGDDVQKSKSDKEDTGDNGADANSQKKSPKEERGDDSREDRSEKAAKRRRHRDDRKHRSRKKSRRHDSS